MQGFSNMQKMKLIIINTMEQYHKNNYKLLCIINNIGKSSLS